MFGVGLLVSCLCVVSGKLTHTNPEVVRGHGFAAPPPGQHPHPPPRRPNRVKSISQFDNPGGFQPGGNPYTGVELGPTTEQVFVSGPPLGDDFLAQYLQLLENNKQNSRLTFEGLMLGELAKRKKKRPQIEIQTFVYPTSPVTLDFKSALIGSADSNPSFNPNENWYGAKQTGLLKPIMQNLKKKQVHLDFVSPSIGSFAPNGRWSGDKAAGLLTYPSYDAPNRPAPSLTNPAQTQGKDSFSPNDSWFGQKQRNLAKVNIRSDPVSQKPLEYPNTQESPGLSFTPSSWLDYRQRVIETGTRPGLKNQFQDEPTVITLDNIAQFLGYQERPDVFNVNVQAVLKTREAQKRQDRV